MSATESGVRGRSREGERGSGMAVGSCRGVLLISADGERGSLKDVFTLLPEPAEGSGGESLLQ